jgi:hypothetical protein
MALSHGALTRARAELPVRAELFGLCDGSDRTFRRLAGVAPGVPADFPLPSVGRQRLRPGSRPNDNVPPPLRAALNRPAALVIGRY